MTGILCLRRIMLRKALSSTFLLTWLTSYDQSVGIASSVDCQECWNSAASVKNSGLFRQSAAQGAWLYTGSLGGVVRQVLIWAFGAQ